MELVTKWTDGNVSITLDMIELGRLIEEMPEKAKNIIRILALRAEGEMKMRAAVDTGAMRSSISTEFVNDGLTAQIGPHVEYAIYQEFGTHRMPAHPFVTPGILAVADDLERLAPELFE